MVSFRTKYCQRKNYRKLVLRRELSQQKPKQLEEKESFSLLGDALDVQFTNNYLNYPKHNNIINIYEIQNKRDRVLYLQSIQPQDKFQEDAHDYLHNSVIKIKLVLKFFNTLYEIGRDYEKIAKAMKMNVFFIKTLYDLFCKKLNFTFNLKELRRKRTVKAQKLSEIMG